MQAGDIVEARFELEREVATGGTAQVFQARDHQLGSQVALKVLTHTSSKALARFLQEAAVLAEIRHPGIVRYVAHGRTRSGAAYLAMEWLVGEDLACYLRDNPQGSLSTSSLTNTELASGPRDTQSRSANRTTDIVSTTSELSCEETRTLVHPESDTVAPSGGYAHRPTPRRTLSVSQTITLGRRLASAVAELHRRGIVHRDIKPANLFLPNGAVDQVKLLDLGAAWRPTSYYGWSEAGFLVGTPKYMAPEQARANGEIIPATDVWSIGCVLYLCLTGRPPFSGQSSFEVLARIVADRPMPLGALCHDVPEELSALIMSALEKEPTRRPAPASVMAEALLRINRARLPRVQSSSVSRTSGRTSGTIARKITDIENRMGCMLLADASGPTRSGPMPSGPMPSGPMPSGLTGSGSKALGSAWGTLRWSAATRLSNAETEALEHAVNSAGGHLQRLANGALLVTIPEPLPPTDQAARIARVALAMRTANPTLRSVLTTGRAVDHTPLGPALRDAVRALEAIGPGTIWVDALMASLLDARFVLSRDQSDTYLRTERIGETSRTVLGKSAPWVGRDRELATILAAFDACVAENTAQAILITGRPGIGKSRLAREFERILRTRKSPPAIVHGRGDPVRVGSRFLVLAPALRQLAGLAEGEPTAVRRDQLRARVNEIHAKPSASANATPLSADDLERLAAFVGELVGVPFDEGDIPALAAARNDPLLMGQLMHSGWHEWLAAECAQRPVVLVIDDLHWGDLPSVQYIDSALATVSQQPLLVLALARPEVHALFPALWSHRPVRELRLRSLSAADSSMLVRSVLGDRATEAVVHTVVERAEGNPFYLEELIRAVDEGQLVEWPDTVLGMVQARLDALSPEAKRILRAASIFGDVFWEAGVTALLGDIGAFAVNDWLGDLVIHEVVNRRSDTRLPGQIEYEFRHPLVREAAYAMLTEPDRSLGHALTGTWLVQAGEHDHRILAEHFLRGRDPTRALPHILYAAEHALEGNDLNVVHRLAERAIRAGASGTTLGRIRALQAIARFWQNQQRGSQRAGIEAADLLPPGTPEWFSAVATVIASSHRLDDRIRTNEFLDRAVSTRSAPNATSAQIICLCRSARYLLYVNRMARAAQILDRISQLAAQAVELDWLTRAHIADTWGVCKAHGEDLYGAYRAFEDAVSAYERAGDLHNASQSRANAALRLLELGYVDRALAYSRQNLTVYGPYNVSQAFLYCKTAVGIILAHGEVDADEARRILVDVQTAYDRAGNRIMTGCIAAEIGQIELQVGSWPAAADNAARAVELLRTSPGFQVWALAVHAQALLRQNRLRDAWRQARQARRQLDHTSTVSLYRTLPLLSWAQCLHALGDVDDARTVIAGAAADLHARAARLPEPELRTRFLRHLPENRRILALAARWGAGPQAGSG